MSGFNKQDMSGFNKQDITAINILLASAAEEAYEQYGNDDGQVSDYMELVCAAIYSRLRNLIPHAMADYRFDNDPSERGL
mgnify:CR=1 FL=1|tara:strand:+ start:696 stop:935 length:240 start_codon:yes stop_codon:yes gene_type:complete